jgi:hypothetical protein
MADSIVRAGVSRGIWSAGSVLTSANRWDHFLARCGINRMGHRVPAGLYSLGRPTADSPVFVTANYTLSYDALRTPLAGVDCYILVLETHGINVWCAAGGGSFSTKELVHRIEATRLSKIVDHQVLILPQLGATGVAAHEVERRSGFRVEYGPIRAADVPGYLKTREATEQMRRVRFGLGDRLILIPVELAHVLLPMLLAAVVLFFAGGHLVSLGLVSATLAGVVLFPMLLPWLPTPNFSTKGFVLGALVALPFVAANLLGSLATEFWHLGGWSLVYLLGMPALTAFLALNFTGSTPVTSPSGVRREIFAYIPVMAWMFGAGLVVATALTLTRLLWGV